MPIGKNSISRVAEGIESPNAAPMNVVETPAEVTVEVEKTIVESTAAATPEKGEATTATEIEKTIVESTAKKPAAKKPAAKKPVKKAAAKKAAPKAAKKEEKAPAAEDKKAPELIGQAVAAPTPKKRGRKPGSKNKPKTVAVAPTERKPRTRRVAAKASSLIAIGEELPVYLL